MKKLEFKKPDLKTTFKSRSFRIGGYSVISVAIVIAIAIAANILVNALPASMTRFDTTSSQLYTISEQSEEILKNLEEDVTIYWICQGGSEISGISILLDSYQAESNHIKVIQKDPDIYPTFAQKYTDSLTNNSLVVECGTQYRYIDSNELYEYDYSNYYTDGTYSTSFNGEGAITSAISYVTNDDLPKIYTLTGHGETTLSSDYQDALVKQNMIIQELSLLNTGTVPEDADCILISAPASDIASEEKELLLSYLKEGGNLYVITDPEEEYGSRPNLDALMAAFGMTAVQGIVIEGNSNNYALNAPYYMLPNIESHTVTDPLLESGYLVLTPLAHGIIVDEDTPDNVTVSNLLTTSEAAYSKIGGYAIQTYEKEEGDLDGPFTFAAAATYTTENSEEGHVIWISTSSIINDEVNTQVSGGNQDFFINGFGWMCDYEDSISIHAKNLDYELLTIDSGTASMLSILIIGILPVAYLVFGIVTWARRKRR